MGFIFPVKDNGKSHMAALFGGAWLTPQILSDEALQTFQTSVARFKDATPLEREILGAIPYQDNEAVLHSDAGLMPRRRRVARARTRQARPRRSGTS